MSKKTKDQRTETIIKQRRLKAITLGRCLVFSCLIVGSVKFIYLLQNKNKKIALIVEYTGWSKKKFMM